MPRTLLQCCIILHAALAAINTPETLVDTSKVRSPPDVSKPSILSRRLVRGVQPAVAGPAFPAFSQQAISDDRSLVRPDVDDAADPNTFTDRGDDLGLPQKFMIQRLGMRADCVRRMSNIVLLQCVAAALSLTLALRIAILKWCHPRFGGDRRCECCASTLERVPQQQAAEATACPACGESYADTERKHVELVCHVDSDSPPAPPVLALAADQPASSYAASMQAAATAAAASTLAAATASALHQRHASFVGGTTQLPSPTPAAAAAAVQSLPLSSKRL